MSKNKYPIVFVHGLFGWGDDEGINKKLPYWGASAGDLTEYLESLDIESYAGSVGPISSAWDRACELYARLTGTRVDYGKAHSEKYKHRRFGRTYNKPMFEGWGSEKKIHLVGHSFGGSSVRMLVYLLTYGSKEEQAVTAPEDLSGLFTGGKESFVQSVVTLCTPHNGAKAYHMVNRLKAKPFLEFAIYNTVGIAGRTKFNGNLVDYHLEQYGLSNTPGEKDAVPIHKAQKAFKVNKDSVTYDMSIDGAIRMNRFLEISPNVYYYSYAFNAVEKTKSGKYELPSKVDFPFLKFTSSLILIDDKLSHHSQTANDGLVGVNSALHPSDEPFQEYDPKDVKPGIWNVMPVRVGDHGTAIGLMTDPEKTWEFYREIVDMLLKTE